MLLARDFREIARDALRGRWGLAVITGLVASLLGASISVNNGNGVGTVGGGSNADAVTDVSYANIQTSVNQIIHSDWFQSILPFLMGLIIVMVAWALISLVLGGAVTLGYAQFNLNLVDENDPQFGDLFSHIRRLWEGFCQQFFSGNVDLPVVTFICDPGNHRQLPLCHDTVYSGRKYGSFGYGGHQ